MRDYSFGSKDKPVTPPDLWADWDSDVVRPYLAHLPDTCGACQEDHRLGVVHVPLKELAQQYGRCCVHILLYPDDEPETGKYWLDLIGTELRYRHQHQNTDS